MSILKDLARQRQLSARCPSCDRLSDATIFTQLPPPMADASDRRGGEGGR
jgi:hypothetical protein